MIKIENGVFSLETQNTSYLFRVTSRGHLEHIYYGTRVSVADAAALCLKNNMMLGTTVAYDAENAAYSLETLPQEYSGIGKGDYRHTPMELILPDGSFVTDFVYESHSISNSPVTDKALPFATGKGETLTVVLADKKYPNLKLELYYTVFEDCNVIARHARLCNGGEGDVFIRKFMSFMFDLPRADYTMLTLDGGWAKEAHIHERPLSYGIFVNDSTTGDSSNRHNPAFMLKRMDANEEWGEVLGFNLIYSGNHYSAVEMGNHDTLRVMSGINPHCFLWKLKTGESFVTPQAVMSYTTGGTNALMANMHDFVNSHIIRKNFQNSERPIVINNWEATFFHFNRRKLLALARKAKGLGVEMFVLDDGWFGRRNSDTAGLGDWTVNTKKLPGGITALAKKINKMGMQFGLWFEPECVNEDSDLYRMHPEWAIRVPEREPSYGRNQLVLDLTRADVRDYIVNALDDVLSASNIAYVKWDYNRHISDMYSATLKNQGEFFHRYILGLYEVLDRIFCEKHPKVLLESCSSGGNRFDLGMLCYSPQIWTSDDTDARERIDIQKGIYCFYPPSCVSCHVSMTPNQQTLRDAPLSTRFNVATFGVLGYELDFGELTPEERKQIKRQIAFYKAHRKTLQYGRFARVNAGEDRECWQISCGGETVAAVYNLDYHTSPARDTLRVLNTERDAVYTMQSVEQCLKISRFGSLIKHVFPITLKADGPILRFVNRHFSMKDGEESYTVSGAGLQSGIPLFMQYSGTGYHPSLRILGDWGSTLYLIQKIENEKGTNNNG
ncbi:MAG: alpha-galactosidase [Ruminococcaceae bacterium]|nr:alpha-galactosidase [Oscillospiraceae bacterium]